MNTAVRRDPTRTDHDQEPELTDLECLSIRLRQVCELVKEVNPDMLATRTRYPGYLGRTIGEIALTIRLSLFVHESNQFLAELESQLIR